VLKREYIHTLAGERGVQLQWGWKGLVVLDEVNRREAATSTIN
jgi:hypothetical protein